MFTPEMLQKGLMGLGIAAGQFKNLDPEVKQALARFAMAAVASGDANGYLKERLHWIDERENAPPKPPPDKRAEARVVATAEFVEDEPPRTGRSKWRRP